MIHPNTIKEISYKINDTTISNWADEIKTKNKYNFPNKTHWLILLSLFILILMLGLSVLTI